MEAINLLKNARSKSSKHLATLLSVKTKAAYSHTPASAAEVKKATRAATQLIDGAGDANPEEG